MGLWGGRSFKEQFFSYLRSCRARARVCVCVCVCWFLLAHTCVTHSASQPAVPQYSLCALQNATFWNKYENKMLPDFTKPQGTMRYRSQITKHATGAIFSFIYDKIHIT